MSLFTHLPAYYLRLLLLIAGLLLILVGLTALIASGAPLPLDLTVTSFVQQFHAGWFDTLMRLLTFVGYAPWSLILPLLIFIALLLRHAWLPALGLLFAQLGSLGNPLIKIIVQRPRPGYPYELGPHIPTDSSFPSGHAATAMVVYGFLIYMAVTQLHDHKLARALMIILCVLYILGMGLSRIYLGEHWFSDVLGGYAYGLAWVALAVIVYQLICHARAQNVV